MHDTVPRLSSWVLPLGWPESKVTIFPCLRSWHRMVASCHIKKLSFTINTSVAQVKLNCHKYTSLQHRKTWLEYCRKLLSCRFMVTLQKVCRITESHSRVSYAVWSCAKCMHSYLSRIRRDALQCSWLPWNPMCTMLFSNARIAQMLLSKGLGMACRLNSPPSCTPECLYAVSILACKIARNLTPTSISARTKPNDM